MTIIAGFKCYEGVVLCADTQETLEHAKRHVPKIRFDPRRYGTQEEHFSNLATAFCGAGDGALIDKLVDEAWKQAKEAESLDDACIEIENSIKDQYKEFGEIYQRGMCPEVQLIFGVKMDGDSKLFTATGPIVNEKHGFDSGGVGHYMADFLARRMYKDHLNLHQCVILAAYMLFQAKEHVEGCGGESQIAVLRNDGTSGLVDWKRTEVITELLNRADYETSELLLNSANLAMDQPQFKETMDLAVTMLETFRANQRDVLEKWDSMPIYGGDTIPHDHFGLPIQLDEKSEPE